MPVVILCLLQAIVFAVGGSQQVPQFSVERFSGGTLVFSYSFLTLLGAMLLSKDRKSAFLTRLNASPAHAADLTIGLVLPLLAIGVLQTLLTYGTAFCFGMQPTARMLLVFPVALPVMLLFVGAGLLIGSCLGEKAAPPCASILTQIAVLSSGTWFDLDAIGGGFAVFCRVLPFAQSYDVFRAVIEGRFAAVGAPLWCIIAYTVSLFCVTIPLLGHAIRRA